MALIFKINYKTSKKFYSCGSWFGIYPSILRGERFFTCYINVIIMYYITLGARGRKQGVTMR